MSEVQDKIKQIIVDELGVDEAEVTENARFIEDLGADSLDLVELVMRFEEEFDIEIPDEDAEKIQSVRDAYAYVEQHKGLVNNGQWIMDNEPIGCHCPLSHFPLSIDL